MQQAICRCCGNEVAKKDKDAVELSDGGKLCGVCTGKVRILYPKSFTWVRLKPVYNGDYDYNGPEDDDDAFWFDPLSELTYTDYRDALSRSDEERAARRAAYGGASAYFRVDDNHPIIEDRGKGKKTAAGEHAIAGIAALGSIQAGAAITVHRRERDYVVRPKRVETPQGESMARHQADRIPEGCYGWIILGAEVPYIYPGDLLSIE